MTAKPARRLDVRLLPTWERHALILSAFAELQHHDSMTIVVDHEPRPLRLQFEELHPHQFVWEQRQHGIGRWEVVIRRMPAPSDTGSLAHFLRCCPVLSGATDEY